MTSEEILRYPFSSVNSIGAEVIPIVVEANDDTHPKLIMIPLPASADDLRKFRLLIGVLDDFIFKY
jgi:hypothetical protein